nr:sugar transferase [Acetatifactor sp.]
LVGTRPPTVDEVVKYNASHWRRISIKPGITGMWQVSGRSKIQNFDEIVEMDVDYIDNWSLFLDVKIVLKTVIVLLKHNDAY